MMHTTKFALIEQFRIGAIDDCDSPWQLEVIAGVLDGNESPESCIRREALEESGCEFKELQHLFSFIHLRVHAQNCSTYIVRAPRYHRKVACLVCQMKERIFNYTFFIIRKFQTC